MEVAGVPEESAFATQRSSQLLRGKAVEPALLSRLPPLLCLLLAKLAARLCRRATSRAARADLIEGALAARGIASAARGIASATHGMGDATTQLMNRKCSGSKNKPKKCSLFPRDTIRHPVPCQTVKANFLLPVMGRAVICSRAGRRGNSGTESRAKGHGRRRGGLGKGERAESHCGRWADPSELKVPPCCADSTFHSKAPHRDADQRCMRVQTENHTGPSRRPSQLLRRLHQVLRRLPAGRKSI